MSEADEDASQLKLGEEFSKVKCLMNAEVAIILEKKVESLEGQSQDPGGLQLNPVLEKSLQYVKRFRQYENNQAVQDVREKLTSSKKLAEYEVAIISNLAPDTIDELKTLVPSLTMEGREPPIDDDEMERMLEELRTIRSFD